MEIAVYYFWESSFKGDEELGVKFLPFYPFLLPAMWNLGGISLANMLAYKVVLKSEAKDYMSKEPGFPMTKDPQWQPCTASSTLLL